MCSFVIYEDDTIINENFALEKKHWKVTSSKQKSKTRLVCILSFFWLFLLGR